MDIIPHMEVKSILEHILLFLVVVLLKAGLPWFWFRSRRQWLLILRQHASDKISLCTQIKFWQLISILVWVHVWMSWPTAWLTMDCRRDIEECCMNMCAWFKRSSVTTSRALHRMLTPSHNQNSSKHVELIIAPNDGFVLVRISNYLAQSSQCPSILWRSSRLFKHTDFAAATHVTNSNVICSVELKDKHM